MMEVNLPSILTESAVHISHISREDNSRNNAETVTDSCLQTKYISEIDSVLQMFSFELPFVTLMVLVWLYRY